MICNFKDYEVAIILMKFKFEKQENFRNCKKSNHIKTKKQVDLLNCVFSLDPYPRRNIRVLLGDLFNYKSQRPIQIWFQNKRQTFNVCKENLNRTELDELCFLNLLEKYLDSL